MTDLSNFFSPKSIAIVGASPKKGKLGNVLIENIKKGGYKGKLYFINPKYTKSKKGYFSILGEIKKPVDLVLIAIPAIFVNQAIEEGVRAKPTIKNFAVISSGFKESGGEGKKLEEGLENLAKKYVLNILGPNCLGLTNPAEKLNATFTDIKLHRGNISIVSQSGALAVALLDWAQNERIGFSKIISIGNKATLDESAIINFLSQDKETKIIALYLEDIKNGQVFMSNLAKVTPSKPIIVLKAGKTSAGQKAVSSHTGSLAQDQDIVDAVFEKLNIITAENIEEFQDLIYYLNSNPIPARKQIIVVTNAGGPGVMASDYIGKSKDIKLLDFSPNFKSDLKKYLPTSASCENPIDMIGDASPDRYQKTLEKIAEKYPDNPVVTILTPQNQTQPEKVAAILAKIKNRIPNLSTCFMGGEKIARAKDLLEKNNIPNFDNPERALVVIEKLAKYFSLRPSLRDSLRPSLSPKQKTSSIIQKALSGNRQILFWREAEKLFGTYGVKLTKSISFENIAELKNKKIFFPCALKTDDPKIFHRLEKYAVMLNIQNEKELKRSFRKMKKATGAKHFLVQRMAETNLELIIGMKRDPSFGPIILCGLGGSFTEIFRDKIILIPPFDQKFAAGELEKLKIYSILRGFRGKKGYSLDEIAGIIMTISKIATNNPEIKEIDINPLTVYNDGKRGQILDAKIFI